MLTETKFQDEVGAMQRLSSSSANKLSLILALRQPDYYHIECVVPEFENTKEESYSKDVGSLAETVDEWQIYLLMGASFILAQAVWMLADGLGYAELTLNMWERSGDHNPEVITVGDLIG
jgi:hypothetical protein